MRNWAATYSPSWIGICPDGGLFTLKSEQLHRQSNCSESGGATCGAEMSFEVLTRPGGPSGSHSGLSLSAMLANSSYLFAISDLTQRSRSDFQPADGSKPSIVRSHPLSLVESTTSPPSIPKRLIVQQYVPDNTLRRRNGNGEAPRLHVAGGRLCIPFQFGHLHQLPLNAEAPYSLVGSRYMEW